MLNWRSNIFLCIIIFFALQNANGQFYYFDDVNEQLEVEFLKKKIETEANKTFFNALIIKNPTNSEVTFQTNFSYPKDWSFIGDKNQRYTVGPKDSIIIPYRACASISAKGEIGYAIVASLSTLSGKNIKNEYSFVNIPKKQDVIISPVNRIEYVDRLKNTSSVGIYLANNGNTDEVFYLKFNLDPTVEITGSQDGYYADELKVAPYKDTTIYYPLVLNSKVNYYNKKFHRVGLKISTVDTIVSSSVWLKELESNFQNMIPGSYTMFGMEVTAQNLFSQTKPSLSTNIYGSLLLKDGSDIYYSFQTLGNKTLESSLKYGRFLVSYSKNGLKIEVGDVSTSMEQSMFGRGASLLFVRKRFSLKTIATKSVFTDKLNTGISIGLNYKIGSIEPGFSYVKDQTRKVDSKIAFITNSIRLKQLGTITSGFGYSIADWYYNDKKRQTGYSASVGYFNKIKKVSLNVISSYGQPKYFGNYNGRFETIGNIYVPFHENSYFNFDYFNSQYAPSRYLNDSLLPKEYNNYEEIKAIYSFAFGQKMNFSFGPLTEKREANSFSSFNEELPFQTRNGHLFGSLRYRNGLYSTFNFSVKGGLSYVTDSPNETKFDTITTYQNWTSFLLSTSYKSRIWGVFASYYHGPYTITEQFAYYYNHYYSKTVRLIPYIEFYLIPKYLKFVNRSNYSYDITSQINRLNLTSDVIGYLGKGWELTFTNTIGYQSNIDKVTEKKYTYSSAYFELKVKKDFNINQPRYQFHNLKVYFFKDINGNGVKDNDEPGIKDVLFSIQKDEDRENEETFNTTGYFMPVELMSDLYGYLSYDNIPNGFYIFEYYPVTGVKGAFTSENTRQKIYIEKDKTIYVPFVENNKIFGTIQLNRSKLSNLGFIDIANIKVSAEDSKGNVYSTLSNANGNFTIYVPNVDKYLVKINNIFYENFELEQSSYEIQLNGYRQFEVNFIFNELKRRVNFSTSQEYGLNESDKGIEIVRRTNLVGTVKDASTMQPLLANIRIVNKQGEEITSATSNPQSGLYSLSFVAGSDYVIEVNTNDYWFYNEKLYAEQVVTFTNLEKNILLKQITEGSLIPMKTLNFASGSAEIQPVTFPELERLLKVLKNNPTVKIAIYGHADDLEVRDNPNKDIAVERAKIVANYLIANGYNRVIYSGFANTRPITDNDTEENRATNRRVEIVVTGK